MGHAVVSVGIVKFRLTSCTIRSGLRPSTLERTPFFKSGTGAPDHRPAENSWTLREGVHEHHSRTCHDGHLYKQVATLE